MAVTVDSGPQATDDPLSNDLKVSMETQVANQDVDNTQFSTLLMRMGASEAKSFKEEWLEDQYLPKHTALSVSAASADTQLSITTNEGLYFKAGDIGRFVQTGEAFRVTAAGASAVTVVRAIGSVAAATAVSGTTQGGLVIVQGSNEQGAEMPTSLITEKTANYNYVGIQRNSYEFTETADWVGWYSGNPLAYHRKKIATEHKREIENALFFGARSYTAGTTHPRVSPGGLDEFISTNITDVAGALTKGAFNDFLRSGLEYGDRTRKALFASPVVAMVLSEFLADNWVHATPSDKVWGIQANAVIDGVWGARIPVFVKGDWKRYGEGTAKHIGSRAYLLDMTCLELKKAPKGRFMQLLKDRQNPSKDSIAEEILSEYGLLVKVEKAHSVLRGVTG